MASSPPYDFDTPVDRRGTWCTQWDYVQDRFGVPDLLPFTISDMDFETAPEILAALRDRLDHGVLGYSRWRQSDFLSAITHWYATRHGTEVDPDAIVYAPSVVYQVSQLLRLWSRPGDGVVAHTPMYDAFPKTVAANGRRLRECPWTTGRSSNGSWPSPTRPCCCCARRTIPRAGCGPRRSWTGWPGCARGTASRSSATRSTPTWRTPRTCTARGPGTAARAAGPCSVRHPSRSTSLR